MSAVVLYMQRWYNTCSFIVMSNYCISCKNRTDAGVAPAAVVSVAAFWHVLSYPVSSGTRPGAFLTVLFIFCAAASEEFLFRGALFALFRDSSGDRPIFASSAYGRASICSAAGRVLISAAAFSAAHLFNIA
ncbi:MAG: CPBP family intramembrane metalloprotease, partial [Firmicutes bacterium]|nr:CPBP family intramembrane metalloprotease [Bacillota bacterium]